MLSSQLFRCLRLLGSQLFTGLGLLGLHGGAGGGLHLFHGLGVVFFRLPELGIGSFHGLGMGLLGLAQHCGSSSRSFLHSGLMVTVLFIQLLLGCLAESLQILLADAALSGSGFLSHGRRIDLAQLQRKLVECLVLFLFLRLLGMAVSIIGLGGQVAEGHILGQQLGNTGSEQLMHHGDLGADGEAAVDLLQLCQAGDGAFHRLVIAPLMEGVSRKGRGGFREGNAVLEQHDILHLGIQNVPAGIPGQAIPILDSLQHLGGRRNGLLAVDIGALHIDDDIGAGKQLLRGFILGGDKETDAGILHQLADAVGGIVGGEAHLSQNVRVEQGEDLDQNVPGTVVELIAVFRADDHTAAGIQSSGSVDHLLHVPLVQDGGDLHGHGIAVDEEIILGHDMIQHVLPGGPVGTEEHIQVVELLIAPQIGQGHEHRMAVGAVTVIITVFEAADADGVQGLHIIGHILPAVQIHGGKAHAHGADLGQIFLVHAVHDDAAQHILDSGHHQGSIRGALLQQEGTQLFRLTHIGDVASGTGFQGSLLADPGSAV